MKSFTYHLSLSSLLLAASLLFASCKPDPPTPEPQQEKIETPRRIAVADGNLYVTCYRPASVVAVDPVSRKVVDKCQLGNYNPEGIAIVGNRIFAVSSWNQTENGDFLYDNKVYVVNLDDLSVSTSLVVGLNPQQVKVVDESHVIVNYNGNYGDQPAGTAIIDVNTLAVTHTGQPMASMSVSDGKVYGYSTVYDADWNPTAAYVCYDPATATATPILEGCGITRPYSINVFGGNIYLTTDGNYTSNGDVACFSMDGTLLWQVEAGMLPSKVVDLGDGSAYVLNEGTWGSNNSSLSRVDLASGTINNNIFSAANGRGLGDVAQDIVVSGGKAYIAVSFSNTIEVVNLTDNKAEQIKL